jgi:tRNA threonylcarbamoyladenosine biosynthesis protein TsaB
VIDLTTAELPRLLVVETSGRAGQVAFALGGHLRRVRRLDETRRHARDLAPAVAEVLAAEGWGPRDVRAVLVSRGPGSYTGLRVGVMSAKAFAYATGCALVAVDTLAAIAVNAPAHVLRLDVIADAQQQRIYVQSFCRDTPGGLPAPASPLTIEPLRAWLARRDPAAWVSGPGLWVYRGLLPAAAQVLDAREWDPRVEGLLELGLARYLGGARDDVWRLEPLYLRPSAAEEKSGLAQ